MIYLYCSSIHKQKDSLCPECSDLQKYALKRIEHCPFGTSKPACAVCKIHCYQSIQREKIKRVMRFSGPRMLLKYPILAIMHLFDRLVYSKNIAKTK